MARRSRSKPGARRGISISTANRGLHSLPPIRPLVVSPRKPVLQLVEDRRLFHPLRYAVPARSMYRRADTKLTVPFVDNSHKVQRLPSTVQFAVPRNVAICIRRKRRKEVLFAKGVGGSRVSRPKRNEFSDVRC